MMTGPLHDLPPRPVLLGSQARRFVHLLGLVATLAGLSGCSLLNDFSGYSFADGGNGNSAMDASVDAGTTDASVDAGFVPAPPRIPTSVSQTGGGAELVSPNYRMSLGIGAPQPMQSISSASYQLILGPVGTP